MNDISHLPSLNPEQVAQRGQEVYEKKLKQLLEPKEHGKFAVIEVSSEECFVGESILEALEKARQKYPDSIFHTVRVGYPGVFRLGSYVKNYFYGGNS